MPGCFPMKKREEFTKISDFHEDGGFLVLLDFLQREHPEFREVLCVSPDEAFSWKQKSCTISKCHWVSWPKLLSSIRPWGWCLAPIVWMVVTFVNKGKWALYVNRCPIKPYHRTKSPRRGTPKVPRFNRLAYFGSASLGGSLTSYKCGWVGMTGCSAGIQVITVVWTFNVSLARRISGKGPKPLNFVNPLFLLGKSTRKSIKSILGVGVGVRTWWLHSGRKLLPTDFSLLQINSVKTYRYRYRSVIPCVSQPCPADRVWKQALTAPSGHHSLDTV